MGLKFDRSEPGFWVSGALHAALVGALVFGFAFSQKFPEAEEGIPVEVVTENQLSEITRGETNAKAPQPEPKPRTDRVAETREERDPGEAKRDVPTPPTRPAEMKVADEAVEVSVPPPPPVPPIREPVQPPEPPKREPVRQAEAKPEPAPPEPPKREELAKLLEEQQAELRAKQEAQAKAEAEARAKTEAKARAEAAAKARAMAEAKARAEAEAKAEAEQRRIAEAKAEAERQKKLAEAKAKAKAEAEARAKRDAEISPKFDPNGIARLLASREPAQSSGSTGREVQKTASLGTATGAAQRLNPSQRDSLMGLLRDQLHRCWQAPIGAQGAAKPPVPTVRVSLNQDGSLAREPVVTNNSPDPLFRAVADSATRAARRCSPLRIPAQFQPYYQDWKDLVVNFDPRDLG
ncbi:MAG TPA: cell envelope integrity protein TolA [Beijerinckiaceae bacterium]